MEDKIIQYSIIQVSGDQIIMPDKKGLTITDSMIGISIYYISELIYQYFDIDNKKKLIPDTLRLFEKRGSPFFEFDLQHTIYHLATQTFANSLIYDSYFKIAKDDIYIVINMIVNSLNVNDFINVDSTPTIEPDIEEVKSTALVVLPICDVNN